MKKMLFAVALAVGVFAITGFASASELQPAEMVIDEDLTVNGSGYFDSVHIGNTADGGVTYFNGTIVNVGADTPVTFGDDVRVDGALWRGATAGSGDSLPLKVDDDARVMGNLNADSVTSRGDLTVNGDTTFNGDVSINGTLSVGVSTIASHWVFSSGIFADYVLRVPHGAHLPTEACEEGLIYLDTTSGAPVLYGCDKDLNWIAL